MRKQEIRPVYIYQHIPSGRECELVEVNPPRVLGSWKEAVFSDTGETVRIQDKGEYALSNFRKLRQVW